MDSHLQGLLRQAEGSFSTVSLHCEAVYRLGAMQRAFGRWPGGPTEQEVGPSVAPITAPPGASADGQNDEISHRWDVWWRKPACWRDDIIWESGSEVVNVVCDEDASIYLSSIRTMASNKRPAVLSRWRSLLKRGSLHSVPRLEDRTREFPLLEPARLLKGCDLERGGEVRIAERQAVEVRARRQPDQRDEGPWPGIQAFDVAIDEASGILLRCTGLVDGRPAVVVAAESVVLDGVIADEIFRFVPPPETRMIWIPRRTH